MKSISAALLASTLATPMAAQVTRDMDAHEHGVSTLEIAIEGQSVSISLTAPGMDLVGFEYEAETNADKAAIDSALKLLAEPANVVQIPETAECAMTETEAHLADDHDEEHGGEEHAHEDEHSHENEHDDGDGHTEFHAHYGFTCVAPEAVTEVTFPYFDQFENAQEIEVVYVTDQGAGTAEATRATPSVRLK